MKKIQIFLVIILLNFLSVSLFCEFEELYTKLFRTSQTSFYVSNKSQNFVIRLSTLFLIFDPLNGKVVFAKNSRAGRDFVYFDDSKKEIWIGGTRNPYILEVYSYNGAQLIKTLIIDSTWNGGIAKNIVGSAISPNLKYLFIKTGDMSGIIVDLGADTIYYDFSPFANDLILGIYSYSFSNSGDKLALLAPNRIFIFNIEKKEFEQVLYVSSIERDKINFSSDGNYIFKSYYSRPLVEAYSVQTGEKVFSFEHPKEFQANFVAITENDSLVVTYNRGVYFIWDFKNRVLIDTISGYSIGGIIKIENKEYLFVPWGTTLVVPQPLLIDVLTREIYKEVNINLEENIRYFRFIGDGSYFANTTAQSGHGPAVFETLTGKKVRYSSFLQNFEYFPASYLFAFYSKDTIFIGNILTDSIYGTYKLPISKIAGIRFSNSPYLVVVADSNSQFYVYDLQNNTILFTFDSLSAINFPKSSLPIYYQPYLLFSKNNKYAVGLKIRDKIRKFFVIDVKSGNIILSKEVPYDSTTCIVDFSYDEKYLFIAKGWSPITIIDIGMNEEFIFDDIIIERKFLLFCPFPDRPWFAVVPLPGNYVWVYDYNRRKLISKFGNPDLIADWDYISTIDVSENGKYFLVEDYKCLVMYKVPEYSTVNENHITEQLASWVYSPETRQLQVLFKLDKPETVSLIITDLLGRAIYRHTEQYSLSGYYTEQIQLPPLTCGVYVLNIQIGEKQQNFKFYLLGN